MADQDGRDQNLQDQNLQDPAITIRYGHIDPGYAIRLASTPAPDDGPVWMVNLMSYRDLADYADGRETSRLAARLRRAGQRQVLLSRERPISACY